MLRGLSRCCTLGSFVRGVQVRCVRRNGDSGTRKYHICGYSIRKQGNYGDRNGEVLKIDGVMDGQREHTCGEQKKGVEGVESVGKQEEEEEQQQQQSVKSLPKLSKQDFRTYNHMADTMDMFHNNFRYTWNTLYTSCTFNKRPAGMSIRQFINTGLEFCHHLTVHHTIEERSIFPVLARRMDIFKEDAKLLTQHQGIHEGLEKFEEYLEGVRMGERELDLRELKGLMEGFGETLWAHLDAEVEALGAENMRLYWSLEEMRRMPM